MQRIRQRWFAASLGWCVLLLFVGLTVLQFSHPAQTNRGDALFSSRPGLPPTLQLPSVVQQRTRRIPTVATPNTAEQVPLADSSPLIRVRLSDQPLAAVIIATRGPAMIRSWPKGEQLAALKPGTSWTVTHDTSRWSFGSYNYSTQYLEVVPERTGTLISNGHRYHGRLRLIPAGKNTLWIVNVLPVEQYLPSVVDSEMPASFPVAAREAQAILARSYALFQVSQSATNPIADLYASVRSQKYQGLEYPAGRGKLFAGESESARSAVIATRGIVLTHRGRPFRTYYSAVCGGATTTGSIIFPDAGLPHHSVQCNHCQASPHYRWTRQLTARELEIGAAQALGQAVHQIHSPELSLTGLPGQKVAKLSTNTGRSVTGVELRQSFGNESFPSPKFSGKFDGRHWYIEGGGHGHGVGLCQWGAKGLAEQGATAAQILYYYYRDVRLEPYRVQ